MFVGLRAYVCWAEKEGRREEVLLREQRGSGRGRGPCDLPAGGPGDLMHRPRTGGRLGTEVGAGGGG